MQSNYFTNRPKRVQRAAQITKILSNGGIKNNGNSEFNILDHYCLYPYKLIESTTWILAFAVSFIIRTLLSERLLQPCTRWWHIKSSTAGSMSSVIANSQYVITKPRRDKKEGQKARDVCFISGLSKVFWQHEKLLAT